MIRKSLVLLGCVLCLVIAGNGFAKNTLVNGIDANYPPFAYVDKKGVPSGFDVEAMDWVAKEIGMDVSHQPIEWSGIIQSLLTKKIDIIASGMSITEERAKKVSFTNPYWVVKHVMVVKKDSGLTVDEILNGDYLIGVQQGTPDAKWLKEEKAKKNYKYTLRYYNSSPLAVEDILNGRITAAAMDDAPAKDAASKKEVKVLGTYGKDAVDFGYAVRKDDKELLDKVNAALDKLKVSPKWDELIRKYNP